MAKNTLLAKLADALRGARADVDALRDQRLVIIEKAEAIRNAPVTDSEISERVDALLNAAEDRARDWASFSGLAEPNGGTADIDAAMRHEPLGLLALFNRDAVRARLLAEARVAVTGKPISMDEREAALAKLAGELAIIERAEEAAIREAEDAGAAILRRSDADPAIFLAEVL